MAPAANGRLRALVIAEMANPDWVSVPLVGWSHARALSRLVDVHLVTHVRNRDNVAKAGLREGEQFTAIDTRAWEKPAYALARLLGARRGTGWSTLTALSVIPYYSFERQIWRRFGDRIARGEFDLVHRLTPLSPSTPSTLAARCAAAGVPFVLGPINGGVPWPRGFDRVVAREREFLTYARGFHRALPGYASTRRHASAIVVGSRYTRAEIPPRWREKTVYIPENALDPANFPPATPARPPPPLRVAFVGRLVAVKCVDVLIAAAAPLVRTGAVAIDIVGDGPEMESLRAQAAREGLGDGVTFAGWIDNRALAARLARAHVFAFPSIRDFGGGVLLEAMCMGLPPIAVNYGGPSELITPRTGFAVSIGSRSQLVAGFRAILEQLSRDPAPLREMGERARQRVLRYFTWDAKAGQTLEVYRWVLGRRDRPDFGMPFPE